MTPLKAYRLSLYGYVVCSIAIVPIFVVFAKRMEDILLAFALARIALFVSFSWVQIQYARILWTRSGRPGALSRQRIIVELVLSQLASVLWTVPLGWLWGQMSR